MLKNNSFFSKLVLIIASLFILVPSFAQKKVTLLPVDSTMKYGKNYFFYALPQTAFKVDVVVNKMSEMKGNYAEYAEKLLGLTNIISQNKVKYAIKSVDLQSVSVADEEYVYAVEMTPAQVKNNYAEKLYQSNNAMTQAPAPTYVPSETVIPDFFRYYSDLAYTEESNEYLETQIVDGVVRQVKANKVQKVNKSDAQKANEAADMISKIREDRYDLLTGAQEVTYSKEALALMVSELNTLEKNYLELFTGFVVTEEEHYTLWVYPQNNKNQLFTFSFSEQTGLSDKKSAVDAENYYFLLTPQGDFQPCENFYAQNKSKSGDGYRIRRALPVHVDLQLGGKIIADFGLQNIFQFGRIETLPVNQKIDINQFGIVY